MRPEFVTFKLIEGPNKTTDLPVNPMSIITIVPITVPGMLTGLSGESMGKAAAGLDCGFKIIPVDHSVEEAQHMLEGKSTNNYIAS